MFISTDIALTWIPPFFPLLVGLAGSLHHVLGMTPGIRLLRPLRPPSRVLAFSHPFGIAVSGFPNSHWRCYRVL